MDNRRRRLTRNILGIIICIVVLVLAAWGGAELLMSVLRP